MSFTNENSKLFIQVMLIYIPGGVENHTKVKLYGLELKSRTEIWGLVLSILNKIRWREYNCSAIN